MAITIHRKRDILIAEKVYNRSIIRGSQIYCGYCGKSMGKVRKRLYAGFTTDQFVRAFKNRNVEFSIFGLYHKACGFYIVAEDNEYMFVPMNKFVRKTEEEIS